MEIVTPAWCPDANDIIDGIPLLANQGVTAIELFLNNSEYFDYKDQNQIRSLIFAVDEYGIRVHSVHAEFGANCDISSSFDSIHENGVEAVITAIHLASSTDARFVVIHASDRVTDDRERRMDRARGVLREMSVLAKDFGVVIAVENLPPDYLCHEPAEILRLLESHGMESIKLCFDTGHANLSGRFLDFAESLLPHAVTTHLHDNDGASDTHLFPGSGTINWRDFGVMLGKPQCHAATVLECPAPHNVRWSEAFHTFAQLLGR